MAKEYTKEQIEEAVNNSKSYSDVYRNLGLKINGGSYQWIKKVINKYEIDVSHFLTKREWMARMTELSNLNKSINLYDTDDISTGERLQSYKLQGFLKFKGIPYECNVCNLSTWMDKPIRLDIDHINGNCADNHINNLQYICPNCHRQKTIELIETEKGFRNPPKPSRKRDLKHHKCLDCEELIDRKATRCDKCHRITTAKISWPEKEELAKMVWNIPTSVLAKQLGVSDSAIGKKCAKMGISKPPRGYWRKIECEIGSPCGT